MLQGNKSALKTPIINEVVYLNRQLAYYGRVLPHGRRKKSADDNEQLTVDIRKCYLYPLLEKAGILFTYAMRQLRGRDYLKRSIELIEEIQAQCYLIYVLRGWSNKVCAELDMICDNIANQLTALSVAAKSQSH